MRWVVGLVLLGACDSTSSTPGVDAPVDMATECTGDCQTTALTATFLATRTLDRAFYGVMKDGKSLQVEAWGGAGETTCNLAGPTPDYILMIMPIWPPEEAGGTTSTFIDQVHDMLPGGSEPYAEVAYLKKTIVRGLASDSFATFDVDLGFVSGTIVGHIYATHCPAMDGLN